MVELSRGLVGSEYWELVSIVLVEGLEDAKAELEQESLSETKLRIAQGKAIGLRNAFNLLLALSNHVEEKKE